ncbi:MAG: DUF5706 domain-containing protein [Aquisalinus sp.]|nr:DUF5706 domain-containing protein [Aquisalinus sp.]
MNNELPNTSIASTSADPILSLRLQFLLGQAEALGQQIQFADMKAVALFALIGVIAANAILNIESVEYAGALVALIQIKAVIMAICLFVVLPRLASKEASKQMVLQDRYSWPALTSETYGPEEHAAYMRNSEVSELIISVARSNVIVARILRRKFSLLRWAFLLAMVDVPVTIILYLAA